VVTLIHIKPENVFSITLMWFTGRHEIRQSYILTHR